jgi:aspartate carbamoyltransferase
MTKRPLAAIENDFKGKDVVSISQFDRASLETVFAATGRMKAELAGKRFGAYLRETTTALMFFEPSSRTFMSFSSAVKRLGGVTLENQNAGTTSSAVKGETLEDTAKVFSNYADLLVVRHPEVGSVERIARAASIPVVNAGDGAGEHPTQAIMDLFTIRERFGSLDGIKGVMTGDLLYGRTVHSILHALCNFNDVTIYLLAPERLKLPSEMVRSLQSRNLRLIEIASEKDIPADAKFWYWTRVQKERFDDPEEYNALRNRFIVTPQLMNEKAGHDTILMHPLPRVGEIDERVDVDTRAIYLTDQIAHGVYARMALLSLILGKL